MQIKKYFIQVTLLFIFLFHAPITLAEETKSIDMSFIDLEGKNIKLSDFRGKWVVVNFWATWCPPCKIEIPELTFFHDAHKNKDAIVLGVAYEKTDKLKLKKFVKDEMISYPIVTLPNIDGKTTPFGILKGLPTTYMISPQGKVIAAHTGMVDKKILEAFIVKMSSKK